MGHPPPLTLQGLQGIFLFTDEASLLVGDALAHEWVNGREEGGS